jgi:glycerol kinase
VDALCGHWSAEEIWKPALEQVRREQMYRQWKKAVTRAFDWIEP